MCFYIPAKQLKATKATKDIRCVKLMTSQGPATGRSVNGYWYSLHQKFHYEEGYEYSEDSFMKEISKYPRVVSYGHPGDGIATSNGFHSFAMGAEQAYDSTSERFGSKRVRCYIPKGSYYFYDAREKTYFSDRIVIVGQLKPRIR